MGLFGDKQEANLRACQKLIEKVIEDLGLDPQRSRLPTEKGHAAWGLQRGSAKVFVFLQPAEGENFIQVVSPVMKVPAVESVALFRRLLELNAETLYGAAFGIKGPDIVVAIDRSTPDLDRSEVEEMITRVGEYADKYDDELEAEFGPPHSTQ